MKTNKGYSEVKSLTGGQIISRYGLGDHEDDPIIEVRPFSVGQFMRLGEFLALSAPFKDIIMSFHCLRKSIGGATFYEAGDKFKINGYNFVLTKTADNEFFMVNMDEGIAILVVGSIKVDKASFHVYEAEIRGMFYDDSEFEYIDTALTTE